MLRNNLFVDITCMAFESFPVIGMVNRPLSIVFGSVNIIAYSDLRHGYCASVCVRVSEREREMHPLLVK